MEPKAVDIKKWTEALRSGKYKQTYYLLQDDQGFCCLGVACDIFIKDKDKVKEDGFLLGGHPNNQPKTPGWLTFINENFRDKTKYSISMLNDQFELTFDEIADLLEAVYIHKVLDQEIK